MLVGLLFAVQETEDRAGGLRAALPLAGVALVEHQARLLTEAGAAQVIVLCPRPTPPLADAVAGLTRRGADAATAATAAEAAALLRPSARLLMLADGLVATADAVAALTRVSGDALLVLSDRGEVPAGLERLGSGAVWAGVALMSPDRLWDVAALPTDYDIQSALLRAAAQAGAAAVVTPADAVGGVAMRADDLAAHTDAVVAAAASRVRTLADALAVVPVARRLVPVAVRRGWPTAYLCTAAAGAAAVAVAAVATGHWVTGALLALSAVVTAGSARVAASLRREKGLSALSRRGEESIPLAWALFGGAGSAARGESVAPLIAAAALVALGAIAERAARPAATRRPRGWGDPFCWLATAAVVGAVLSPTAGFTVASAWAASTAWSAIRVLAGRA